MASHCCVKALREGERIGIFPYVKRSHHPKLSGVAQGSKRKVSSHAYQNACLEKDENERSSKFHLPFLIIGSQGGTSPQGHLLGSSPRCGPGSLGQGVGP